MNKEQEEMERVYEKVTMQELGGNPTGTRQEIVWKAMSEYAQIKSIAFYKWMDKEIYTKGLNGLYYKIPGTPVGQQSQFTLKELYKIFDDLPEK